MKIRTALLTAATATAVLAGTGTASAAIDPPANGWDHAWSNSTGTAKVYVEEYGDVISLCDTKANSYEATVQVRIGDTIRSIWVAGGSGTCVTHRASEGGKYNLPEGTKITIFFLGGPEELYTDRSFVNDH